MTNRGAGPPGGDAPAPNKQVSEQKVSGVGYLRRMSRKVMGLVVLVLVLSAAIFILFQGGVQLYAHSVRLDPLLVLLSFAISCVAFLLQVAAWRLVLANYGVRQSIREDLRIYCYSALGVALPGSIWVLVGRSALYHRLGANSLRAATAGVVETFLIGIAALGVYALTTIIQPGINLWQRWEIGVGITVVVLILIHPRVLNYLIGWALEKSGQNKEVLRVDFTLTNLVVWIVLEAVVVVIGGLAVFVLLTSLIVPPAAMLVPVIAAWAAALAVSTLLFWLPGTLVLHAHPMVLALSSDLALSVAGVFVPLVRIWSIASILIIAGLAWLFLDRPQHEAKIG